MSSVAYEPRDQLYLWSLVQPGQPVLIGELQLVRSLRGVSLRYGEHWLRQGFALSEDLPLLPGEFLPTEKDTAVGAVDDARPDRWGERLIRFLDRPPRLSLLEYLYFAGDDRFGALGVSVSVDRYEPRRLGPLPLLADTAAIHGLVQRVLANEPVPEPQKRLLSPGVTMGGARPKALIEIDGEPWVVKFSEGEPVDAPLVEHASMTLAAQAGIRVATTRAVRLADGHAVAVRRFDRMAGRRGVAEGGVNVAQMRELFRRMVFNILIDNTDDHEKNHVLLVDDAQHWQLSPAFDVLPSGQALGYQQMRVGMDGADATLENAMSMCALFALKKDEAVREVRSVCQVVSGWRAHFAGAGVSGRDIELLGEQIDRPFLRRQRDGF